MHGLIIEFQKICVFFPRYGTGIRLAIVPGEFVRKVAQEKFALFPHSSVHVRNQGGKRSHFHVNNSLLVLPFLLFVMLQKNFAFG